MTILMRVASVSQPERDGPVVVALVSADGVTLNLALPPSFATLTVGTAVNLTLALA